MISIGTEIPQLQINAKGRDLLDLIYQLYDEARTGCAWFTDYKSYHELLLIRDPHVMGYIVTPVYTDGPPMLGMPLTIDHTVPDGTIELRDKDDRIVGKIYNIG
mgnify:CR=1 FL=1